MHHIYVRLLLQCAPMKGLSQCRRLLSGRVSWRVGKTFGGEQGALIGTGLFCVV
jgi:hypothetical protein